MEPSPTPGPDENRGAGVYHARMARPLTASLSPLVILLAVTTLVISHGCASTGFMMARPKVTLYGTPLPPKARSAPIEVFETQKPDRPYREVARIEVRDTNDRWSLEQIQKKAREVGADGVIITGRSGRVGAATPVGNGAYGASRDYGMVAVAFVYR